MHESELIENERLEVKLLLEAIYLKYGYDFRNYAFAHTKRRLEHRKLMDGIENYATMIHRIIYNESFFNKLLLDLSINVTEMFRDPWVYLKIRELIIPHLKTYPFIKVWHAGCSAGQEVYSMGILLEEEGIKDRSQIYATDFNEYVLSKAKMGIYPMDLIREYTANYQKAGGRHSFSDYYTADYDNVLMKQSLKDKVLFSSHNLVTDGVFGEMNIIFCRNVLIYFDKDLQNRVFNLFYDSLCPGGFLCLGSKESLKFSGVADKFEVVSEREKIYRKKR
ncbi:CheR family methyltransferase [Pseudodesulfovibrio piezophilus]|uniref:Methylase of chemotaxis methyl-accepting protein n=1 Tax=Pseudodesulfovibrio piezophilus (strain DSM 21447 / JCM 15486 / C1TLV30) TaxID=1322246 RepID=M1WMT4_PSEP2|nr:protein-glutamate O-methyltransferase CheR [Pseudodesulfovibrio piezophilus]CCH49950.1 Methylase of chemotaxis methyl-accepting protein [Pseudodesulfovibrio piezophilus C1TLV30]